MPYLVSARRARMGVVPMIASGAAGSDILRAGRFTWGPPPRTGPGPMPIGPASGGPVFPGPAQVWTPPPPVALPSPPVPVGPVVVGPIAYTPPAANAGTPVPAGYPTSQMFIDSNGGFWQYSSSQSQWINVGTPYNTGAASVPPAAPTGSTPSAPTSLTTPTTAPAPVSTVTVSTPSTSYQEILDWLQSDTLGSTIGFNSIPNWIVVAAAGLLAAKVSGGGGKKRNPHRRAFRRGRR
jgi:hypothetical protein